jgi:hypothetical protein
MTDVSAYVRSRVLDGFGGPEITTPRSMVPIPFPIALSSIMIESALMDIFL